jgi:O-antigen/teichoic acid export membrane protein
MSRTRRFLGGIGLGYANQLLVTLVGLWLAPFVLHRLGSDQYGLWLLATQLLGYLMLLDVGVIALLPREIADASGRRDTDAATSTVPQIMARARRLVAWQMPIMTLAAVACWLLLPRAWADVKAPLAASLAIFIVLYPFRMANAALEGLQEMPFLGKAFFVGWAGGVIATVVLVVGGLGLWAVALGWGVNQLLLAVMWSWRMWTRHRAMLPTGVRADRASALDHLRRGLWVSLSQVATMLIYGSDLLIIGKLLGPAAVVPYSLTAKLVSVLQHQPHMLMHAALPGLAELKGRGDRVGVMRVVKGLTLGMLLVSGLVAVVVMLVNRSFVGWWVGPAMYGGDRLTLFLLVVMLLRHWGLVMAQSNFALGEDRLGGIIALAEGVLTVVLSIALVHALGVIGVVLAAVVSVLLVRIPFHLAELSRRTERGKLDLLRSLAPWAVRTTLLMAVAGACARYLPESHGGRDLRTVIVSGSAGLALAAIYAAAMYGFLRRSELAPYLQQAMNGLRRRLQRRQTAVPPAESSDILLNDPKLEGNIDVPALSAARDEP